MESSPDALLPECPIMHKWHPQVDGDDRKHLAASAQGALGGRTDVDEVGGDAEPVECVKSCGAKEWREPGVDNTGAKIWRNTWRE
eukprot:4467278-Pleurochrysis_carterae.AAC.1